MVAETASQIGGRFRARALARAGRKGRKSAIKGGVLETRPGDGL
jgi:hypothetical protein